jgi:hypothetical protein
MGASTYFIREQSCDSVPGYQRRVARLAVFYVGIVLAGVAAMILIVVRGRLFVTLTQRSNVETLTLAVILLLFAVLTLLSLPGAWGAVKIAFLNFPARLGRDALAVERRKQAAMSVRGGRPDAVYLNCRVSRDGAAKKDVVEIPLRDEAGSLGVVVIDGVKMTHEQAPRNSSNSLFAFFERRIAEMVRKRDPKAEVSIVTWETIDDEAARQYESLVAFAGNLSEHLGSGPLWPTVTLTEEDIATLTREASELCPTLRNEAHLPDVEYEGKHTLPLVPEPLAFLSLSRQERRVDPVASMGCAFLITLGILALVILFILLPPWVPGK